MATPSTCSLQRPGRPLPQQERDAVYPYKVRMVSASTEEATVAALASMHTVGAMRNKPDEHGTPVKLRDLRQPAQAYPIGGRMEDDHVTTTRFNPLEPAEELFEYYSSGERKRMRAACESCHERKLRCIMLRCGQCQQCYNRKRTCVLRTKRARTTGKFGSAHPYIVEGHGISMGGLTSGIMPMSEYNSTERRPGMASNGGMVSSAPAMTKSEIRPALGQAAGPHVASPSDVLAHQQVNEQMYQLFQPNQMMLAHQSHPQPQPMAMLIMPSGQSMYVPIQSVGTIISSGPMPSGMPILSSHAQMLAPHMHQSSISGCMPVQVSARMVLPANGGYTMATQRPRSHKAF
mmetsp:Transcript_23660/g.49559  ORF Transcript_23660/g.49559 Transcript_23660/m.49559 type:complete len:347 (+) Transcript_23660:77-1117(+)